MASVGRYKYAKKLKVPWTCVACGEGYWFKGEYECKAGGICGV